MKQSERKNLPKIPNKSNRIHAEQHLFYRRSQLINVVWKFNEKLKKKNFFEEKKYNCEEKMEKKKRKKKQKKIFLNESFWPIIEEKKNEENGKEKQRKKSNKPTRWNMMKNIFFSIQNKT